ncbi:SGNH/GDSL hydrolase family protein [Caulobacter sp. UC70_42]|uniref:SGNH/GDSL hydrolase family protein n=1 Tax=Caulobacter sp. UC70_42 TaxID=3374551 RepID=UPI003756AEDB
MTKARQLAAAAYELGSAALAAGALQLALRYPMDYVTAALSKGGGVNPVLATLAKIKAAAATYDGQNPIELSDMASPPTISFASTTDASLTVKANCGQNPSQFRVSPGRKYIRNGGGGQYRLYLAGPNISPSAGGLSGLGATAYTPNLRDNGESIANAYRVTIRTAAPVVEWQVPRPATNAPYRIIVDGHFVARDGYLPATGTADAVAGFLKADFGSSAMRTITLEMQFANGPMLNVSVASGYSIAAPPATALLGLCLGDSQVETATHGNNSDGTNPFRAGTSHMVQFADMIGAEVENAAVGGTGFLNRGTTDASADGSGGNRNNVRQMLPYVMGDADWDYVNIAVSQNDKWVAGQANVEANFIAVLDYIRTNYPRTVIFLHGYVWGGAADATALAEEARLFQIADARNDPGIITIPRRTKSGGPPITGTGYVGATNGSGNSDTMISGDGIHLSREGQNLIAQSDIAIARTKLAAL